jgi:hypothetical protein
VTSNERLEATLVAIGGATSGVYTLVMMPLADMSDLRARLPADATVQVLANDALPSEAIQAARAALYAQVERGDDPAVVSLGTIKGRAWAVGQSGEPVWTGAGPVPPVPDVLGAYDDI